MSLTACAAFLLVALLAACADEPAQAPAPDPAAPLGFVAMTFNTGTSAGALGGSTAEENGGYGPDQATTSDLHYGNGLAFPPFIDQTAAFLALVSPDVVGFQEIFWSGDCPTLPPEAKPGFVCESWQDGDPTVAQLLLGDGYQLACHPGHPDKCLGVKRSFATIRGCDAALCLDFLDGLELSGCGSGSRLGSATLDLAAGGELTVINVHGTSGMAAEDMECRRRLYTALFTAGPDGGPLVPEGRTVILGDWNTDPGRLGGADPSADVMLEQVGPGKRFEFLTEVGEEVPPTYLLFNIDHVVSDAFDGSCVHPGAEGQPPVIAERFFDHEPAVCSLVER